MPLLRDARQLPATAAGPHDDVPQESSGSDAQTVGVQVWLEERYMGTVASSEW